MRAIAEALKLLDPETFHHLCFDVLKARFPGANIRSADGAGGDKGIDVFAGELTGQLTIWQAKQSNRENLRNGKLSNP